MLFYVILPGLRLLQDSPNMRFKINLYKSTINLYTSNVGLENCFYQFPHVGTHIYVAVFPVICLKP